MVVGSGAAVHLLLSLIAGALTARLLGAESRGVFALLTTLASLVYQAVNLGLPNAFTVHVSSGRHSLSSLLRLNLRLLAFTSAAGLLLFYSLAFLGGPSLVGTASTWAILLSGWMVVETLFVKQAAAMLRGMRKVVAFASMPAVRQGTRILLTLLLIWGLDLSVMGAVLATLLSSLAGTLLLARGVFLLSRQPEGGGVEPVSARALLRFGSLDWITTLTVFASTRLDAFLVANTLDMAAVGHYTQATGLAEQVWLLPSTVSAVLLPSLAATGGRQAADLTARSCRFTLMLLVGVSIPALLLAEPVILLLYGSEFGASVPPFRVLLLATVALALRTLLSDYFRSEGKQRINIATAALALLTNLLANLWAIPRFGITGAALASLASYGLDAALGLVAFRVASGISPLKVLVPQREDLGILLSLRDRLMKRLHR